MRMEEIMKSINKQGPVINYTDLSGRLDKMDLTIYEKNLVMDYIADKSREEFYRNN